MARKGLYPDAPKPPFVAGYEVAGVVDGIGEGVTRAKDGDRVAALVRFGGHADVVCAHEEQVFAMPNGMTFGEGAAWPVNYITAYHMLFEVYRLRANESVLVHMAAGGVGTAVLQLCKTLENITTYGTCSARKHDYVRSHGCTVPIDYHAVDYAEEIMRLTAHRGVDLVLDPLGGPDWAKGYGILCPAGMLIAFGWANMNAGEGRKLWRVATQFARLPKFNPMNIMSDNRAIAGVNVGHLWQERALLRREGDALMDLYRAGKIKPHVDREVPFAEAADAHRYLESGQNVGKVVLVP
jgi:NADPH:quinone reductase-like Zn-dependent oxidoreductase